jgi:hypothetical protein
MNFCRAKNDGMQPIAPEGFALSPIPPQRIENNPHLLPFAAV